MTDTSEMIRPAAVLWEPAAVALIKELGSLDAAGDGVWRATPGLWQRYDQAWDGPNGDHGNARLAGTISAVYGSPTRYDITLYRITLTEYGRELGWTFTTLCDDALQHVGLTLESCPRTALISPPKSDPFHRRR